jgi:hypothetical protein
MPASCSCGRTWTGLAQAHCPTCHRHFGSVAGFDRHRPSGHCQDPAPMTTRAGRRIFRIAEGPLGGTWVLDSDRIHPQHAKRMAEKENVA